MARRAPAGQDVLRITGGAELERVSKALLRQANGKDLRKEMGKALREEARPAMAEAKSNVLSVSSKGSRGGGSLARGSVGRRVRTTGTGLRASMARAMRTQVTYSGRKAGVNIRVDSRRLPENQRNLPRALNKGSWRHPVFGTDTWVTQVASPPGWFSKAMKAHGDDMRRAMGRVMEKYVDRIDRLG